MIPLTTSGRTNDNLFWVFRQALLVIIITLFVTSALDNYVMPLLEAWEVVVEHIITNEDSLLNTRIIEEVDVFTANAKLEIANTDWESMSDIEKETKIYTILNSIDEIEDELFTELWGIVLVVSVPLLTIPILIWLGLRLVLWICNLIINLVARVFKVNSEIKFYWKGNEIFKSKAKKEIITKKFEELED